MSEQKVTRAAERHAAMIAESKRRERERRERAKWARLRPPKDSAFAHYLKVAELIIKAYYSSPANRLRLENIILKAQMGELGEPKAARAAGFTATHD